MKKKSLVVIVVAAIIVSSLSASMAVYETHTKFGSVNKFTLDSYYTGTPLPAPFEEAANSIQPNLEGNVTVHYHLANFAFIIWKNNTLGSFEFGLELGPGPTLYQPGAPNNSYVRPFVWISLIHAKYKGYGFLGFKTLSMSAYNTVPALNPINFSNWIEPQISKMYQVNESLNTSSRQATINTLGNVYYLYPVITNESTGRISSLIPGQYFIVLHLELYDILPWGSDNLGPFNITEPWLAIIE